MKLKGGHRVLLAGLVFASFPVAGGAQSLYLISPVSDALEDQLVVTRAFDANIGYGTRVVETQASILGSSAQSAWSVRRELVAIDYNLASSWLAQLEDAPRRERPTIPIHGLPLDSASICSCTELVTNNGSNLSVIPEPSQSSLVLASAVLLLRKRRS